MKYMDALQDLCAVHMQSSTAAGVFDLQDLI